MHIRAVLGASRTHVLRRLVAVGGRPLVVGLLTGLLASLAAGRLVARLLFEVTPGDPAVLASAVATVGAVGLLAALASALRGLQMNLSAALKAD
jgi:hypothetical protein